MTVRHAVGCMTGTSIDAVDAALVELHGHGLALTARVLHGVSQPLGPLQERLRALADQSPLTAGEIATLTHDFAQAHVDAIRALLSEKPPDLGSAGPAGPENRQPKAEPSLIAIHGQTVYHAAPLSWQLFQPAPVAAAFECPVVCDLRAADLAAGGQGAPITPLADYVFLRAAHARAVLNLGGFCNVTLLPPVTDDDHARHIRAIHGADLCACNHVLDHIARRFLNRPYDHDGDAARSGRVVPELQQAIAALLRAQRTADRALGTGDELFAALDRLCAPHAAGDAARSACAALAEAITAGVGELAAARVTPLPSEWLIAGGGCSNAALLAELQQRTDAPLAPTDTHGLPAAWREAAAMAVLGALCQDEIPITLPQITGAHFAPLSGLWTRPPRRPPA